VDLVHALKHPIIGPANIGIAEAPIKNLMMSMRAMNKSMVLITMMKALMKYQISSSSDWKTWTIHSNTMSVKYTHKSLRTTEIMKARCIWPESLKKDLKEAPLMEITRRTMKLRR
jgi:hypothetical protein